jgi:hypothetical protein
LKSKKKKKSDSWNKEGYFLKYLKHRFSHEKRGIIVKTKKLRRNDGNSKKKKNTPLTPFGSYYLEIKDSILLTVDLVACFFQM